MFVHSVSVKMSSFYGRRTGFLVTIYFMYFCSNQDETTNVYWRNDALHTIYIQRSAISADGIRARPSERYFSYIHLSYFCAARRIYNIIDSVICMAQWRRRRRKLLLSYPHPKLSLNLVPYRPLLQSGYTSMFRNGVLDVAFPIQAGFLVAVLTVVLSYSVVILTVLSLSAISTSGNIKAGGVYCILSL